MQSAPDDLHEALLGQMTAERRANAARRAAVLSQPLHSNCYLPPSSRGGFASTKLATDEIEKPSHDSRAASNSISAEKRVRTQVMPIALLVTFAAVGMAWLIIRHWAVPPS
jgi:hypothetical protein